MSAVVVPEIEHGGPLDVATPWRPNRPQPGWSRSAAGLVALASAGLYLANLSANGLGNAFYAAAVKSAAVSWKAFFFGSLDPGSFITVDKPPLAFWVQASFARLFGYSTWTLLVPEALAGAGAVLVLHHVVRRWIGDVAAVLAAVALALTPIAALMFRFNDPDGIMTFLVVLASWAAWTALERGTTRWLLLTGVFLGLAFLTKMLEAWIAVPGFALAYLLFGPPRLGRRIVQLLLGGVAMLVSAGWWVAVVQLLPVASRPYIGSSGDNSELSLIFGYNGLGRVFGQAGLGTAGGGTGGHSFGGLGGGAGWGRLLGDSVGGQVSWLFPLAGLGLVAGLFLTRRAHRVDRSRAGFVLFGVWALADFLVFSLAQGIFHPYYTVAMAPPVAALAAGGAVALWRLGRAQRRLAWMLPVGVAGTALWAAVLLARTPGYDRGLGAGILAGGAAGAAAIAVLLARRVRHRVLIGGAAVLSSAALLAGPTAYVISSEGTSYAGSNPQAGPAVTASFRGVGGTGGRFGASGRFGGARAGTGGGPFAAGGAGAFGAGAFGAARGGSEVVTSADRTLVAYLEAHRDGAKYLVAGNTSSTTDGLIIASGEPVVTIGGFDGQDPVPTLSQFESMVRDGELRYVLVSGAGGFAGVTGGGSHARFDSGGGFGGLGGFGRGGTASQIDSLVEQHGTAVTAPGLTSSETLYLVTQAEIAAASSSS